MRNKYLYKLMIFIFCINGIDASGSHDDMRLLPIYSSFKPLRNNQIGLVYLTPEELTTNMNDMDKSLIYRGLDRVDSLVRCVSKIGGDENTQHILTFIFGEGICVYDKGNFKLSFMKDLAVPNPRKVRDRDYCFSLYKNPDRLVRSGYIYRKSLAQLEITEIDSENYAKVNLITGTEIKAFFRTRLDNKRYELGYYTNKEFGIKSKMKFDIFFPDYHITLNNYEPSLAMFMAERAQKIIELMNGVCIGSTLRTLQCLNEYERSIKQRFTSFKDHRIEGALVNGSHFEEKRYSIDFITRAFGEPVSLCSFTFGIPFDGTRTNREELEFLDLFKTGLKERSLRLYSVKVGGWYEKDFGLDKTFQTPEFSLSNISKYDMIIGSTLLTDQDNKLYSSPLMKNETRYSFDDDFRVYPASEQRYTGEFAFLNDILIATVPNAESKYAGPDWTQAGPFYDLLLQDWFDDLTEERKVFLGSQVDSDVISQFRGLREVINDWLVSAKQA